MQLIRSTLESYPNLCRRRRSYSCCCCCCCCWRKSKNLKLQQVLPYRSQLADHTSGTQKKNYQPDEISSLQNPLIIRIPAFKTNNDSRAAATLVVIDHDIAWAWSLHGHLQSCAGTNCINVNKRNQIFVHVLRWWACNNTHVLAVL